ncbi:MAG TPA: rhomboid family intramembrane serine protease [Terriglobales bacterium]|nr:rhomboid family intramembrane serine protease [Terriglobales bacterium]
MPNCLNCGRELAAGSPINICAACSEPATAQAHAASFPVTRALIAINVLVFLLMMARGVSLTQPTAQQLLRWGANLGTLTLDRDWWRLLASVFVHIGVVHIAVNMWSLWNAGQLAEHIYGRATYLFLYLFTGAAGSVASAAWHPFTPSAGASGAIFGVVGALLVTFKFGKLELPHEVVKPVLSSLTAFTLFNVIFGAVRGGVDNAAHLGGLLSGALIGALMNRATERGSPSARRRDMALLGVALVAVFLTVRRVEAYVIHLDRALRAESRNQRALAIDELREVVKARPNTAAYWVKLGRAYAMNAQPEPALAALKRGTELDASSVEGWTALGEIYLAQDKVAEALDAYRRVATLAPNFVPAQINLGVALARTGDTDGAIEAYKRAQALDRSYPLTYSFLGAAYLGARKYDDALRTYQEWAQLQPENPDAHFGIAQAYKGKGMQLEAQQALERSMELREKLTAPRKQTSTAQ